VSITTLAGNACTKLVELAILATVELFLNAIVSVTGELLATGLPLLEPADSVCVIDSGVAFVNVALEDAVVSPRVLLYAPLARLAEMEEPELAEVT